jgi:hypothetical protein
MATSDQLPVEAADHGDRIVVAPDRGTRLWAVGGAMLALVVGVLLLATGDGAVVALAGVAATLAGVYLLLAQAQRLEFDSDTARRRSLLRPATVPWSEVTEVNVSRRYGRTPVLGSSRRLGGLNLSMGAGGRRGRGRGLQRDKPFTVLTVEHGATGADLTMELNRSEVAQGETLVATLSDRGWLPDEVKATVDTDR